MTQGKRTITDDELMTTIATLEGPAFTVRELAAKVDLSEQGVRERLAELESKGAIVSKKPGARTVIWWASGVQPPEACSA